MLKRKAKNYFTGLAICLFIAVGAVPVLAAERNPVVDFGMFHNVYTPDPTDGDFAISGMRVTLEGKELEAGEFSFRITEQTDSGFNTDKAGGFSAVSNNKLDGSISFQPGQYTKDGTYYYAVRALPKTAASGSYTVATNIARVTVTVTDNNGMLEATVNVTDGVFCHTYTPPTDEWLENGWDYEEKENGSGEKYVLLKKYTGSDTAITVSGAVIVKGETLPVRLAHSYDSGTGSHDSCFSGNSTIKSITFVTVDGIKATAEDPEDMAGLFHDMTALESIDLSGLGGKTKDISGMFKGCASLKEIDLTGMDTSECTKAVSAFEGCTALESAELGGISLRKLDEAADMFRGCGSLGSLDLSKASWKSSIHDTSGMFAGCGSLTEIKVPADFNVGAVHGDMFRADTDTLLKVKGSPSEAFRNNVFPELREEKRYLGTATVTARVTLSGKTLSADMFTYKLYRDEAKAGNLIATAKNSSDGSITFRLVKIYDITDPVKLVMVQDKKNNIKADKDSLSVSKSFVLKADGTLELSAE